MRPELVTVRLAGLPPIELGLHQDVDPYFGGVLRRQGVWEPLETREFIAGINPNSVVVDAGAYVGYYTLIAAHLAPVGVVYGFEPDPQSHRLLQWNVRHTFGNNVANIRLFNAALADTGGVRMLNQSPTNRGDQRLYDSHDGRESALVQVVRLSDIVQPDSIDLLKMDCQGSELMILRGAGLRHRKPGLKVLMEFWPYGIEKAGGTAEQLIHEMEDLRFRWHVLHPQKGLLPVTLEILLELATVGVLSPATDNHVDLMGME